MAVQNLKFYFDMDNVLVNFNAGIPKYAINTNRPSKKLNDQEHANKKKMWLEIERNHDFWRNLPAMRDANLMLITARIYGELFILSKTPSAKNFMNGQEYVKFIADEKREWILRNMGEFFDDKHIIICDTDKAKFMNPSWRDVLIDDRQDSVLEWSKFGGHSIHFKAPQQVSRIITSLYSR